ncbi:VWA domain-containing protein [Gymnodinialimonas ulvae]|uniref:VWA domain-containing protein n=1 Tax=Gymnodinialimonas ulvae TaxID=3126504 RepID=UPI00309FF95C
MRACLLALLTLIVLPLSALAQANDRPNTILVLDGSGSMWGQIDGVNKIVIARNVIADMLAEMSDDVSLGLTVYGHRERGSCADIETIVPPAPGTQDRILDAVNAINPRGRTPMTDSVVAAAQSLRHTEEAATVILVSDGIENCNPDPCAIAAELEASGVAFTAHVIGFDVASEPEARAQMQCIADNTGGQFLTADNAAELSSALEQVVAAQPTMMRLEARVEPDGALATRPISWRIIGEGNTILADNLPGASLDYTFDAGLYTIQATREEPSGPVTYQINTIVTQDQSDLIIVTMPAIVETSPVTFTARVEPDQSVPASPLNWTLSDATGTVLLGPVQAPGGNVALLPGDYTLSVERVSQGTTHDARFTVEPNTPAEVIIPLPALSIDVTFIARIGDVGGLPVTDPVIWEVTPLDPAPELGMTNPTTTQLSRGAYRVTGYWTAQEVEATADFVIVDQPREIIVVFDEPAVTATLTAPDTASVAADVEVGWQGPGDPRDYLTIRHPETDVLLSVASVGTEPTVGLRMPAEPGTYTINYSQDGGNAEPIGTATIEITDVAVTLAAPDQVAIGSPFAVEWAGTGYDQDRIAIVPIGDRATRSNGRAISFGNPLDLTAPTEAGDYELHYILREDERVMATRPLEVTAVQATLTAPTEASGGSTIEIGWTGPDADLDYIAVGRADADGSDRWEHFTRTSEGSPLELLMPVEPGQYLIRYFLYQDRVPLAEVPITITLPEASITAPATAVAGTTLDVGWTGPDNDLDYIGIGRVGADGNAQWENFARTNRGNPVELLMPVEPGDYVIQYFVYEGRAPIAASAITLTDVEASITAPAMAQAGSTIEIVWTGPDNDLDFIGIGRADADGNARWENFVRTNRGNPLDLLIPTEPGSYLIQYFLYQDRTPIATVPITVAATSATLTAPTTADAGSTIEIGWTGPDNPRDFIAIGRVGADGSQQWENFTRTSDGSPLDLLVPTEPGDYLIQYFLDQDRVSLAAVPLTVTAVEATLTVPQTAVAGSTIEVGWTGPAEDRDFIGIGIDGATGGGQWENFTRVADGNPVDLLVPTTPGTYAIQYFLDQDRVSLVSETITVTPAEATLTAPQTAVGGSTIEIGWTGPDYDRDFIGIGLAGSDGGAQWENYTRTSDGSPMRLLVPVAPGTYEIQYFMDQDRLSIASVSLTVTAAEATLTAPTSAAPGSEIEVGWTGPNYSGDFIAIGPAGASGGDRWQSYTRTSEGSPLTLTVPDAPGSYMIQYFVDQDRLSIASVPITVQ